MEAVDYFNVTAWNNLAENCVESLKKGDRVIISGHLSLRKWENKEGKKYNIINMTADTVAASLEFCQLKIQGGKNKKDISNDTVENNTVDNEKF